MKRFLLLVIATIVVVSVSMGQGKGFGLGLMLGEPTGLSAKGWVSPRGAVDAGLAWSLINSRFFHAHIDYLWHFQDVVNTRQQVLPYIGIGGRLVGNRNSASAGVRVPAGLAWLPQGTPLDVFFEIAPIVDFAPATEMSINGGIGIRFFFR